MYNRYIPQPDGTYRRNRMQEPQPPVAPQPAPPMPAELPPPCLPQNPPPTEHPQEKKHPHHPKPTAAPKEYPAGSFLKNLLPKDLDTGDLLIILLLLLVAGESEAEKSNALLTLALYFLL